jgi:cytochrome P450
VGRVLRDRRFGRIWTDREPVERFAPFNALHRHQMMENEPPEHTRLRALVASAFARGHVERLRPRVAVLAGTLLDAAGPDLDLIGDFAEPLPVQLIAELLGVPESDRPLLRPWSAAIVRMYEFDPPTGVERAAVRAAAEFADYVRVLARRRRADPRNDLISHLATIDDDRWRDGPGRHPPRRSRRGLTEDELVASAILLLNAGHEASVNAFGNGIVALLRHPDELRRLRGAPDRLLAPAVEEMLRYDAPLQWFERTATVEVPLGEGVTVPAGRRVAVLLGAANRDPAVFTEPARFDVGRDPNPHLDFGAGLHFCLGSPLARLELAGALAALLRRAPTLDLAGEPQRRPGFVLRGYRSVPARLSAGG